QIKSLRNLLWKLIQEKISEVTLNGSWEERVPNNLNISLEGVDGESVVRRLDLMGIAVSTGSACASGTVEPSHVLLALGLTPQAAKSSIRITLGKYNTEKEVRLLTEKLTKVVTALRTSL